MAAQFFNVAAQVCTWSFTIQYARDVVGVPADNAGWYLQASLILFLISRFVMTYLLGIVRPTLLLAVMGALGVGLALTGVFSQNMVGLIAVVSISASLSLMFPTIYGVALQGLGEDTKFGAAGLVMAILGGALLPLVQGKLMDQVGAATAFIVPGGLPGARDGLCAVRPAHAAGRRPAGRGGRALAQEVSRATSPPPPVDRSRGAGWRCCARPRRRRLRRLRQAEGHASGSSSSARRTRSGRGCRTWRRTPPTTTT